MSAVDALGLSGFRGWLLLLAFAQGVLLPARVAINAIWFARTSVFSSDPNGAIIAYVGSGVLVGLFVFSLVVTGKMLLRSPQFPALVVWEWVIISLILIVARPLLAVVLGAPDLWGNLVLNGLGQAIGGGLWVAYVRKSVRVRNTFTPGFAAPPVLPIRRA